jgi:ketosteroid isomerase-like protein
MAARQSRASNEQQIRERIRSWTDALRAKDLDAVMAHWAPDALAFDLAPPLRRRGDEIRRALVEWFPTWDGPIGYERRDLVITAGDEVAFSHCLDRLTGRRTNGDTSDVWFRATVCFRKLDGEWMIVHEHTSVPFAMDGSYRALVDLAP